MLEILFSLTFLAIVLLIIVLSVGIGYGCALIHKHLMYSSAGEWLVEHIYCPLARVLLLITCAFLLLPLIHTTTSYGDLLTVFFLQDFLINLVNILFASSLIISFLPVLNHPSVALPILSCIAITLLFQHHLASPRGIELNWVSDIAVIGKMLFIAIATGLAARWLNREIAEWADNKFIVTGSISMVSDINYLILQIPIVLAYGASLAAQLR